jgi:PilZ domain-containing protein
MSQFPELPDPGPVYPGLDAAIPAPTEPQPTSFHEARRFPRFHDRARIEAAIHPLGDDPQAPPMRCAMLTRDLSRGGINLLHSDQLFPGQKIEIILDDAPRWVEVLWCRRLANRCFSAGCRFVTKDGTPDDRDQRSADGN